MHLYRNKYKKMQGVVATCPGNYRSGEFYRLHIDPRLLQGQFRFVIRRYGFGNLYLGFQEVDGRGQYSFPVS